MLAIVAIVAALAAPLGAYFAAARRLSGKIKTSEASSLWDESRSIREDYRRQLADLRAQLADTEHRCAERIEALEATISDLRAGGPG